MEEIIKLIINKGARTNTPPGQLARSSALPVATEAIDKLITEGGEMFYNYLNSIGLSNDPSLIVLSSIHHYYYDSEEMNRTKTVVNLKELNRIKEIKSLLHSHLHFLPERCNFVGCFVNNNKIARFEIRKGSTSSEKNRNSSAVELGIVSRFPFINRIYSLMDSKTNSYMSKRSVALMLGVHGFKVMDMTEYNGITFFHSQKIGNMCN